MPSADQPVVSSDVLTVSSTTNLKVYFKLSPTDHWTLDKSLICLGHSKTKGAKIGHATFSVLMYNNEFDSSDWIETNQAMRFNAGAKYQVDMSNGYKTPYLLKVTDIYDGAETPVWYGYVSSVDQDHKAEDCIVYGLTYAGLLDQQQIIGGWYLNINDEVDYYLDHVPVYNPNGIGNKSAETMARGVYLTHGLDKTLEKDTKSADNLWKTEDMINQIDARLGAYLFNVESNHVNPWIWAKDLYTGHTTPIYYSSDVAAIIDSSSPISDYTLQGKTLWAALVELVESIDSLTISEEIGTAGEVVISIVKLKD